MVQDQSRPAQWKALALLGLFATDAFGMPLQESPELIPRSKHLLARPKLPTTNHYEIYAKVEKRDATTNSITCSLPSLTWSSSSGTCTLQYSGTYGIPNADPMGNMPQSNSYNQNLALTQFQPALWDPSNGVFDNVQAPPSQQPDYSGWLDVVNANASSWSSSTLSWQTATGSCSRASLVYNPCLYGNGSYVGGWSIAGWQTNGTCSMTVSSNRITVSGATLKVATWGSVSNDPTVQNNVAGTINNLNPNILYDWVNGIATSIYANSTISQTPVGSNNQYSWTPADGFNCLISFATNTTAQQADPGYANGGSGGGGSGSGGSGSYSTLAQTPMIACTLPSVLWNSTAGACSFQFRNSSGALQGFINSAPSSVPPVTAVVAPLGMVWNTKIGGFAGFTFNGSSALNGFDPNTFVAWNSLTPVSWNASSMAVSWSSGTQFCEMVSLFTPVCLDSTGQLWNSMAAQFPASDGTCSLLASQGTLVLAATPIETSIFNPGINTLVGGISFSPIQQVSPNPATLQIWNDHINPVAVPSSQLTFTPDLTVNYWSQNNGIFLDQAANTTSQQSATSLGTNITWQSRDGNSCFFAQATNLLNIPAPMSSGSNAIVWKTSTPGTCTLNISSAALYMDFTNVNTTIFYSINDLNSITNDPSALSENPNTMIFLNPSATPTPYSGIIFDPANQYFWYNSPSGSISIASNGTYVTWNTTTPYCAISWEQQLSTPVITTTWSTSLSYCVAIAGPSSSWTGEFPLPTIVPDSFSLNNGAGGKYDIYSDLGLITWLPLQPKVCTVISVGVGGYEQYSITDGTLSTAPLPYIYQTRFLAYRSTIKNLISSLDNGGLLGRSALGQYFTPSDFTLPSPANLASFNRNQTCTIIKNITSTNINNAVVLYADASMIMDTIGKDTLSVALKAYAADTLSSIVTIQLLSGVFCPTMTQATNQYAYDVFYNTTVALNPSGWNAILASPTARAQSFLFPLNYCHPSVQAAASNLFNTLGGTGVQTGVSWSQTFFRRLGTLAYPTTLCGALPLTMLDGANRTNTLIAMSQNATYNTTVSEVVNPTPGNLKTFIVNWANSNARAINATTLATFNQGQLPRTPLCLSALSRIQSTVSTCAMSTGVSSQIPNFATSLNNATHVPGGPISNSNYTGNVMNLNNLRSYCSSQYSCQLGLSGGPIFNIPDALYLCPGRTSSDLNTPAWTYRVTQEVLCQSNPDGTLCIDGYLSNIYSEAKLKKAFGPFGNIYRMVYSGVASWCTTNSCAYRLNSGLSWIPDYGSNFNTTSLVSNIQAAQSFYTAACQK
ncbi:uncharacterized protein BJ171DRAFT_641850 [Polychytrium aggregatum]|uniref:uncharacterized protein n=1 Tax=Polychytrium aggregatum TaxID=110093 RepID=UPI0022FF3CAF|nr:uncharacterized protein BJ171DRAFT_641850 [Polychytrium aggregatum]KAI9206998.1 hypothetical protein BJ171DRAFT_641850 [Polychytrium aggregatum]